MGRAALVIAAVSLVFAGRAAYAQDPPPLPRVVLDLQGLMPVFPNDSQQLADSRPADQTRALTIPELPGAGLGGRAGVHLYLFKYRAITFGVGGEVALGHSSSTPAATSTGLVPVDERLSTGDGQISVNFGTGHGWSYLSGGAGRSRWSLHPSGAAQTAADTGSLPTVNYGGGARWFAKKHLAFSLDVRIYEIQPGSSFAGRPGSPRTRLLTIGAGVSLK
jgi:hypothetical protein